MTVFLQLLQPEQMRFMQEALVLVRARMQKIFQKSYC